MGVLRIPVNRRVVRLGEGIIPANSSPTPHRSLACRGISVRWRAIFVVLEGERPRQTTATAARLLERA
jgi:hypothetical protein